MLPVSIMDVAFWFLRMLQFRIHRLSFTILAARHVKQGIEAGRFRVVQTLMQPFDMYDTKNIRNDKIIGDNNDKSQ